MVTLGQYLYEHHKRQAIDFRLRVSEQDGVMRFYIHPHDRSGETVDFYVVGNLLIPAAVNGVIGGFRIAIEADCESFKNAPSFCTCPKCQADLQWDWVDSPRYVAIDGGMGISTPDGPGEAWVRGIQTCAVCGHQWEVGE
jgi:hypothetical protein